MNLEVLKLPLGFIRVVQLPLVIIAFASMSGWGVSFGYNGTCPTSVANTTTTFSYSQTINTFKLTNIKVPTNSCITKDPSVALFDENISSSPAFFVFTGVVSMLFVLAMLGIYLFAWGRYESNNLYAIVDFLVTAVLALFWFIGTIAWWSGAVAVGADSNKGAIEKQLASGKDLACTKENPCTVTFTGGYGSLVISVFAGWACVLLFVADCWFVYKETIWFRNRQLPPTITGPHVGAASPYTADQQGGYRG